MIVLGSLTVLYSILCAYTDLKDRTIYYIPSLVLSAVFIIVNLVCVEDKICVLVNTALFILVALLFKKKKVWGAGDSDYLILFSQVLLYAFGDDGILKVLFWDCILLVVGLLLSVVIGAIECYLKDRKFSGKYKAAALPGLCIVVVIVNIYIGGTYT